jgi:hypothetical protein
MSVLQYSKAIVAGLVVVGSLFVELAEDGLVTDEDWKILVVGAITAFATWLVPNKQ